MTSYADRQVHLTETGDRRQLGRLPTATGVTTYVDDDRLAVKVRVGWRYQFRPRGHHRHAGQGCGSEPWQGFDHRTTTFSLRTGALRVYTARGHQPARQIRPGDAGVWRTGQSPKFPLARLDDVDRLPCDVTVTLVRKLLQAARVAGFHRVDQVERRLWTPDREYVRLDEHPDTGDDDGAPPHTRIPAHRARRAFSRLVDLLAYPWQWDPYADGHDPDEWTTGMLERPTSATIADLVRAQFPGKATRTVIRAFARLMCEREHGNLHLTVRTITAARGMLDPDTIAGLLEEAANGRARGMLYLGDLDRPEPLRQLLRRASLPRRRRLLTDMIVDIDAARAAIDTIRMCRIVDGDTVSELGRTSRTWDELHDRAVVAYNSAVAEANADLWATPLQAFPDELARLNGTTVDGAHTIVVPDAVGTLYEWGQQLGHCIGSYSRQAATGKTWLFGLARDGKVVATGEVGPNHWADDHSRVLTQLRGRFNEPVDAGLYHRVGELMDAAGVFDATVQVDPELVAAVDEVFANGPVRYGMAVDVPF